MQGMMPPGFGQVPQIGSKKHPVVLMIERGGIYTFSTINQDHLTGRVDGLHYIVMPPDPLQEGLVVAVPTVINMTQMDNYNGKWIEDKGAPKVVLNFAHVVDCQIHFDPSDVKKETVERAACD